MTDNLGGKRYIEIDEERYNRLLNFCEGDKEELNEFATSTLDYVLNLIYENTKARTCYEYSQQTRVIFDLYEEYDFEKDDLMKKKFNNVNELV